MAIMIEREIEKQIVKWIDSKEIIAIRGTRQCGKTTFLRRLAEILIHRNVSKDNIHLISFEDDIEKEKFEKNPKEYISYYNGEGKSKHYFLLDEVQYITKAGKILKLIYDEVDNVKIIITGSSTLDLREIGSFLVGRVLLFEMYPFSFGEFLKARNEKIATYYQKNKVDFEAENIKENSGVFLEELNRYLKEYVTFGGYPSIVLEKDIEKKKILLKNLFLTYIEKDIVKVYGSGYRQRISDLIKHLSAINTAILNYEDISKTIGLYNKEVKEILHILEETYVIRLIKPFHKNLSTELRKNPKVYFIDTGLRNFISGRFDFNDEEYGKLLENYILLKILGEKVNYWRTKSKAEVDFVINESIPVESKMTPKITRSLRSFIDSYNPKSAFIANLKNQKGDKINKTRVLIVPYCFL